MSIHIWSAIINTIIDGRRSGLWRKAVGIANQGGCWIARCGWWRIIGKHGGWSGMWKWMLEDDYGMADRGWDGRPRYNAGEYLQQPFVSMIIQSPSSAPASIRHTSSSIAIMMYDAHDVDGCIRCGCGVDVEKDDSAGCIRLVGSEVAMKCDWWRMWICVYGCEPLRIGDLWMHGYVLHICVEFISVQSNVNKIFSLHNTKLDAILLNYLPNWWINHINTLCSLEKESTCGKDL